MARQFMAIALLLAVSAVLVAAQPIPTCSLNAVYSVKAKKCVLCPAGSYAKPGAKSCTKCSKLTAIGYYPGFGVCSSFIVCKPGMMSYGRGCGVDNSCFSDESQCCVSKGPEKGCIEDTKVTAAICPPGQGLSQGYCRPCAVGTWNRGGLKCKTCPKGTTSSEDNSYCVDCERNTYSKGGRCVPCPKGTYQAEKGKSSCKKCTKTVGVGYYAGFGNCGAYIVCSPGKAPTMKGCDSDSCWLDSLQCCVGRIPPTKCVNKPISG